METHLYRVHLETTPTEFKDIIKMMDTLHVEQLALGAIRPHGPLGQETTNFNCSHFQFNADLYWKARQFLFELPGLKRFEEFVNIETMVIQKKIEGVDYTVDEDCGGWCPDLPIIRSAGVVLCQGRCRVHDPKRLAILGLPEHYVWTSDKPLWLTAHDAATGDCWESVNAV